MWEDGSCHPNPDTSVSSGLPDNWNELTVLEKIELNPLGCDLTVQDMWADGTCYPPLGTDESDEEAAEPVFSRTVTDQNFSFTVASQPTCATTTAGRTCLVNFSYRNLTDSNIVLDPAGLIEDATVAIDTLGNTLAPEPSGQTTALVVGPGASNQGSVTFAISDNTSSLLRITFLDQGDCGPPGVDSDATTACQAADATGVDMLLI